MVTYKIDLDVTPGTIPKVINVKQYQTDAVLKFYLYSRRSELTIGSTSDCAIRGTKSDGHGYSVSATYNSSEKSITAHLTAQMTAVHGRQPFELTLTDSTGKMITATFYLDVQRSALDEDTMSNSQIRELTNALDHSAEIIEAYNLAHYDDVPTAGSNKAVTSSGIKSAIDDVKNDILPYDTTPKAGSSRGVTSSGIKSAIDDAKNDILPYDTTPKAGSSRGVTSGGIKTAIDAVTVKIKPSVITGTRYKITVTTP